MSNLDALFQKARSDAAARIIGLIKTIVDGTEKGKKPDHAGATQAAMIAELTQCAANIEVLNVQLKALKANMDQTGQHIQLVVEHLTRNAQSS